jgi:hypothetical protein
LNRKFLRFSERYFGTRMGLKRGIPRGGNAVYDVLFLDRRHEQKVLASGVDRDDACAVARTESERRGIGRMFLAGSELGPVGEVIVIVDSRQRAA